MAQNTAATTTQSLYRYYAAQPTASDAHEYDACALPRWGFASASAPHAVRCDTTPGTTSRPSRRYDEVLRRVFPHDTPQTCWRRQTAKGSRGEDEYPPCWRQTTAQNSRRDDIEKSQLLHEEGCSTFAQGRYKSLLTAHCCCDGKTRHNSALVLY